MEWYKTYSEIFGLDESKYECVLIRPYFDNTEIVECFLKHDLITISDLLKMTPENLQRKNWINDQYLLEIEKVLCSIQQERTARKQVFVVPENEETGRDILIEAPCDVQKDAKTNLGNARECAEALAQITDVLGQEMVEDCSKYPARMRAIQQMFIKFCTQAKWQNEMRIIMQQIPEKRREKKPRSFIQAYTQDKHEQDLLASMYTSNSAALGEIINYDGYTKKTAPIARKFLEWCAFDLREDVVQTLDCYCDKRSKKIVQMRMQGKTLDQIGYTFHLTRERIRQLLNITYESFFEKQRTRKIYEKLMAEANNGCSFSLEDLKPLCADHFAELHHFLSTCAQEKYTHRYMYVKGIDAVVDKTVISDAEPNKSDLWGRW